MKRVTIQCDSCGALKQEVNHWWKIGFIISQGCYFVARSEDGTTFSVDDRYTVLDLCGEECLSKVESQIRRGQTPNLVSAETPVRRETETPEEGL